MRRSLSTLLFLTLPVWAQFQTAPVAPYPQDVQNGGAAGYPPEYQAQSQYPNQSPYPQQQQYPQYPAQQQQQYPSSQPQDDQQERDFATDQQHGVARLRIVQGDVNVRRGDNGMLTAAVMNAPLLSRDHLETGNGSRAEVQLDNANAIRMAPDTELTFASLVFGRVQAQLGMGTIILRVFRDSQTQVEVDTPSVAFHPITVGEYRISVFDNGTSQVSVRSGRLEMSGPRGSQTVEQGQSVLVRGDANDPEFQQAYEQPRDQFDEWSASRDADMLSSRSAQYVSGDIYGAEDLDRYGNWVPSQYGQVWVPQGVGSDWSPYSNGQWSYADYYGWTWIGYEPWGWAPYHYGRWFYNTGVGWCWWPGARLGFGFHWSPALVSFFGFGGGLGWVSLAPYEVYHPWWGRGGFGRYEGLRAGYDIHGFRNAGFRGGAITAGFNTFAGAGHRFSIANAGQLRAASVYHGGIPVSPNASSYRFSERSVNMSQRYSQATSRPFFSRPSTSFNNSRYATGGSGSYNGSRYSTGGGAVNNSNSSGGWQRFGSAAPQRTQPQSSYSSRPNGNAESGWHSFGQPQQPSAPRYNNSTPYSGGNSYGRGNNTYQAPAQTYRAPAAPSYNNYNRAPSGSQYSAPRYSAPQQYNAPRYSAPQQYNAPRYNAPPQQHYNAPSAPRGGGGGGSAPRQNAGGGGSHSNGGGGGHHR